MIIRNNRYQSNWIHPSENFELTRSGIDYKNRSLKCLLDIAQINVWERDLITGSILDFGYHQSLATLSGDVHERSIESFISMVHPDDRSYVTNKIDLALNQPDKPDYYAEFRVRMRSGTYEYIAARGRVMRNPEGRPIRMTGIWFSIDAIKKAYENNQREQVAMEKLSCSRSVLEMTSCVAHEINQPLAVSAVYLDACIERLEKGEINKNEMVELLKKSSEHIHLAGNTIHRINNLIQPEKPSYEPVSLGDEIENAVVFVKKSFKYDFNVTVKREDPLPEVKVDRLQIKQVLVNLLNNSVDAFRESRTEDPCIKIRLKKHVNSILLSVADNGPGISSIVREKLFTPFYSSKKNRFGMGLLVSRSIVEAHGGCLKEKILGDNGCCFEIFLPV